MVRPLWLFAVLATLTPTVALAQTAEDVQRLEDSLIRQFAVPAPPPPTELPVLRPEPPTPTTVAPASETAIPSQEYSLLFDRSLSVGPSLRLRGIQARSELGFTIPNNWDVSGARAIIRFQHSPALIPEKSNLVLEVNERTVASFPLDRIGGQLANVVAEIPPEILRDNNTFRLIAQQVNDPICQDPDDPSLWTEIMPDSSIVFTYQPQPIVLDFSRYPYPFLDNLGLETNRVAYLLPETITSAWLTQAATFHAKVGRIVSFRPLETRVISSLEEVERGESVAIIGSPSQFPQLSELDSPLEINGNRINDANGNALPPDVGYLLLSTVNDERNLVLAISGNDVEGVNKSVAYLAQQTTAADGTSISTIGTGQALIVATMTQPAAPGIFDWPGYLPNRSSFSLSDLRFLNRQPITDTTIRGGGEISFDFRTLPNVQLLNGSRMNLHYSHGPQLNPRTSAVEVLLDDVVIAGERISTIDSRSNINTEITIPPLQVRPNTQMTIAFRLNARERQACRSSTFAEQLWGTLHATTNFNLAREQVVELPNLELMTFGGFPFSAPQDLSNTAIVMPDSPSANDIMTMLMFAERMGRITESRSIQLEAFLGSELPSSVRSSRHLVGIGRRETFPIPEVFDTQGFGLLSLLSRQLNPDMFLQTLPDSEGVVRQILSPWNNERVVMALAAQANSGLSHIQEVFYRDAWFFQFKGDTALINVFGNPTAFDQSAYTLRFLRDAPNRRTVANIAFWRVIARALQRNWLILPIGIVVLALILYGISQVFLKQYANGRK